VFLAICIVLVVGRSTVSAAWVPGLAALPWLGLGTALVVSLLAWSSRRPAALLLAIAVPGSAAGAAAWGLWQAGWHPGSTYTATSSVRLVLAVAYCAGSAWLAVFALRIPAVIVGVLPLGLVLTVDLLNFPAAQGLNVLLFLASTLALLLWTTFQRARPASAAARDPRASARLIRFSAAGTLSAMVIVVVGFLLPPASTVDRSLQLQFGPLQQWSQFLQQLQHPGAQSELGTIGFSTALPLGGAVKQSDTIVLTYVPTSGASWAGPIYLRGVDLYPDRNGEWRYVPGQSRLVLPGGTEAPNAQAYAGLINAGFTIKMINPPAGAGTTVFYPGQLVQLDRGAELVQASSGRLDGLVLHTVDQVLVRGSSSAGAYQVTSALSTAAEDELRAAGAGYPPWLRTSFGRPGGSLSSSPRIATLARQITAGSTNPYDQALAIESHLRSNYKYTLGPPTPPTGSDPVAFFLFTSKQGYCQYFAASMGQLLQALGVPTRLVNGFGPGTWDSRQGAYVVRSSDAHTWVEAFFPGYGWIPFEPTPAAPYAPIPRGSVSQDCTAAGCAGATAPNSAPATAAPSAQAVAAAAAQVQAQARRAAAQGPAWAGLGILIGSLLALLAAGTLAATLFMHPRTAAAVWRRTRFLAALTGVRPRRSETPSEFGVRFGSAVPEAQVAAAGLAAAFSVVAYAPPATARAHAGTLRRSWAKYRAVLLAAVTRSLAARLYAVLRRHRRERVITLAQHD
jgi:transglutaminase-like putative cysteine protease